MAEETARVAADAVAANSDAIADWAQTFALFSDPTRLKILVAVHAAPGSSVTEIAAAANVSPNTVTQALAALQRSGTVTGTRDGRHRRWSLSDEAAHQVLHHMHAPHSELHPDH